MPTLPPHAILMRVVVNSVVSSSGDRYKTENADDGKAKSRGDTRATNCEAGTRERPANLFILALSCWCYHPFMYNSFSCSLHFRHKAQHMHTAFWTRIAHAQCIQACIDSTLSLSHATPQHSSGLPPTTMIVCLVTSSTCIHHKSLWFYTHMYVYIYIKLYSFLTYNNGVECKH